MGKWRRRAVTSSFPYVLTIGLLLLAKHHHVKNSFPLPPGVNADSFMLLDFI